MNIHDLISPYFTIQCASLCSPVLRRLRQDAMPPSRAVLSQLPSGIVWLRAPVAPPKSGDSGDMVTVAALEV